MKQSSVIIVGGGVIGLSLGWELLLRGHRVTLVDRQPVGRGASWAAVGILPPARLETATDPLDRLRGLSHALIPDWSRRLSETTGIDVGLRRRGGWYLAETRGERAAMMGVADYWRDLRIECERQPLAALSLREPALAAWAAGHPDATAWWVPDEYQIRTPDFLRALHAACESLGGELRQGAPVTDVRERAGHAEVRLGESWSAADRVVLCGGAWTGGMAKRYGLEQSVIPVRGQILMLRTERPLLSAVVNVGNRYVVCRDDGRTLVGSVEEEVGFREGTTPEVLNGLRDFAERLCPSLRDAPVERSWSGFRPMTFDGFPMIGRIPDHDHLYVAAGHFRSGIHLASGTAVTLADLLEGRRPVVDPVPFRVGKQQQRIDPTDLPSQ